MRPAKEFPIQANLESIQSALEAAGIEFIPENGGGAGAKFKPILDPCLSAMIVVLGPLQPFRTKPILAVAIQLQTFGLL